MAPKPVTIEFVAEVAQYLRAVKKVEVSTDDIADALVAVSKDSKDLEKDLDKAMRESARDTDRLARVVDELSNKIEDTGDAAGKGARGIKDGFSGVKGSLGEIGSEAGQEMTSNIGEAISSGGGDLTDIITGIGGGLVSGLTVPVGVAAAGAIGIAGLAFANAKQKADNLMALAESYADAISDMYEFGMEQEDKLAQAQGFSSWLEDNYDALQENRQALEDSGIDWDEYVAAVYEGGPAWDLIKEKINEAREADSWVTETGRDAGRTVYGQRAGQLQEILDRSRLVRDTDKEVADKQADIADAVAAHAEAVGTTVDEAYELDDAYGDVVASAQDYGDEVSDVKTDLDHIVGQAGKTVAVTVQFKPGDAFTQAVAEQLGP